MGLNDLEIKQLQAAVARGQKAQRAVNEIQREARRSGVSNLTDEEINAEIRATRAARGPPEPPKPRAPSTKSLLKTMTEEDQEQRKQTNLWLTEAEKELLKRAARRSGVKLSTFIREHALAEAKRVLE